MRALLSSVADLASTSQCRPINPGKVLPQVIVGVPKGGLTCTNEQGWSSTG